MHSTSYSLRAFRMLGLGSPEILRQHVKILCRRGWKAQLHRIQDLLETMIIHRTSAMQYASHH